ncbi:MAG: transcription-repair coupling factor [bacterium]
MFDREALRPLFERIELGERKLFLKGIWGSGRAYFLAALAGRMQRERPFLIVAGSVTEALSLVNDLKFFQSAIRNSQPVLYFPPWEILPYEPLSPDTDTSFDRINTLASLVNSHPAMVVTTVAALMQRIPPKSSFSESAELVMAGEEQNREILMERLREGGYQRVDMVEEKGEMSARGDILDLFCPGYEHPVRIEFFGDEVESIRTFDYSTQLSREPLDELVIYPAKEITLNRKNRSRFLKKIEELYRDDPPSAKAGIINDIKESNFFSGIEHYFPYIYEQTACLLDYLPENTVIGFDEPFYVAQKGEEFLHRIAVEHKKSAGFHYPDPDRFYLTWGQLKRKAAGRMVINFGSLKASGEKTPAFAYTIKHNNFRIRLQTGKGKETAGLLSDFFGQLKERQKQGYRIVIVCHSKGQLERTREIASDYGLALLADDRKLCRALFSGQEISPKHDILITVGGLDAGFEFPAEKLLVVTEEDIFGQTARKKARKRYKSSRFLSSFSDLNCGDLVVHVEHGIGRYQGITRLEIEKRVQDFMLLEYAGGDKLYLPLERLYLIQKYLGGEETVLNKLGSNKWSRAKKSVKEAVRKMADELVKLYAARSVSQGHAFVQDTTWQQEFEAAFDYTETPDQLKVINEVKQDMESERAMDRLVCGDVGYGKTEVALRAAFKAVMDEQQVAVLTPTTLLAHQHFENFAARLKTYPVNISLLTRYKTAGERKKILQELSGGQTDIIIGTHALLQKSVVFKKLGLLVVDEEQHFGVAHKEKIKMMRNQVDILTLTATPIPRTLNMALLGMRELSIIDTPPEDRQNIVTEVAVFDDELIREAILRERERDGQVFFVHNRVESIGHMADYVSKLVPEARVVFAHGKMKETVLDEVMRRFVNREIDILVTTTIIESGIDIPNANTIIINRADRFGLAQLYQLRGRVGRSHHRAYAYLLISPGQALTETAQKRLQAIEALSELGAGFRLAAHDLEIRGAGNMLGREQHGSIAAVGFDLYCQLLEEAIGELKGEVKEGEVNPEIDLNINASISHEYIPDTNQLLTFYKKISSAADFGELEKHRSEMRDRYGRLPRETESLMEVMKINIIAKRLRVKKLSLRQGRLAVTMAENPALDHQKILRLAGRKKLSLSPDNSMLVPVNLTDEQTIIQDTLKFLITLN